MSGRGLRIRPLAGGSGRIEAAIETPVGGTRVLRLEERTDLLPGPDFTPQIDGDYGPDGGDLSWAVIGAMPLAMGLRVPIRAEGAIQVGLIENLERFSRIWGEWRPDLFGRIEITAEEEMTLPEPRTGAVVAVSGGVDSLHTLRHARDTVTDGPLLGLMLWGFDHSVDDRYFLDYARKAAASLDRIGISLCLVETNWTEVCMSSVRMDFATGLISSLQAFSGRKREGFIAADYHRSMTDRMLPYGSNPITNPLLSGVGFPVTTFGYDHTRLEKLESIVDDPASMEVLRICNSSNCGVCEKCQRTRWGLFALGCDRPPTFGGSLPLPRPWLALQEGLEGQHIDGYWSPVVERAGENRAGTRGLAMLRLQYRFLLANRERRGLWRVPALARLLRRVAGFEKRLRGKSSKLRTGWRR